MLIVGTDYSGLGAPEQALKDLGVEFKTAFACDIDKYVTASYLANHETDNFYPDVTKRDNASAPAVDMYVFGFPCQAFSLSGKRLGFEDTRGTLFFNSLEYLAEKRPRIFIAENVKGLLSHDKKKGTKGKFGNTFNTILDCLAATANGQYNLHKYDDCINYHIHYQVLNTKDYGLPQNRERIFIIGFRDEADSIKFRFPKKEKLELRLIDLLEPEVDEKYYLSNEMIEKFVAKFDGSQVGYINQDSQASKVYDTESEIPTLTAGSQGYSNGYIIVCNDNGKLRVQTIDNCLDSNYAKGIDNHGQRSHILVSKEQRSDEGKKIRKQHLKDGKDFNPRRAKEIIFREQDYVQTLQTNQTGDNWLLIKEATSQGYAIAGPGDSINISQPESKTRRGRVGRGIAQCLQTSVNQAVLLELTDGKNQQSERIYAPEGIASCLASGAGGGGAKTGLYYISGRVRKLTPLETFRLQGFPDDFFYKCQELNSDTQLYKQSGNSMSTTVLKAMYKMLHWIINLK